MDGLSVWIGRAGGALAVIGLVAASGCAGPGVCRPAPVEPTLRGEALGRPGAAGQAAHQQVRRGEEPG